MIQRIFHHLLVPIAFLSLMAAIGQAETVKEDREGGIIGTGIVGTITELGSIHLNGQRVVFEQGFQVTSPLGTLPAENLAPGDTVAVIAHPNEQDWSAQSITRRFAIIGPVAAKTDDHLVVMGTIVEPQEDVEFGEVAIGDWIAVSGLWRSNQIIASKIEQIVPRKTGYISGSYLETLNAPRLSIGGTQITGISPEHIRSGDAIHAEGAPLEDGLAATRLWPDTFSAMATVVSAEGYLSTPNPSGLYTLLGSGLVAFTDRPGMVDPKERTIVCGVGQDLIAADVVLETDEQRALLHRLGCK